MRERARVRKYGARVHARAGLSERDCGRASVPCRRTFTRVPLRAHASARAHVSRRAGARVHVRVCVTLATMDAAAIE
eukprot:2473146-Pleurochrysis_carterae.AAC.1